MKAKDFLSVSDLDSEGINLVLRDAREIKAAGWTSSLTDKTLALLFEKPSLRTRASFEVAMRQAGGQCIYLSPAEVGLGSRESVPDVARVLSRYVDAIAARTFSHQTIEVLAEYADVPVINALSDAEHPCQALADLFTIYEKKGDLHGLTLAYIGDGNNIATSLMLGASLAGMNFRIASPDGYHLKADIVEKACVNARENGSSIFTTFKPEEAASGADIVYTDVWTSMGQEAETAARKKAFRGFQVNTSLMSLAEEDAIFMHDLPAHRGEEVTDEVIDGPQSVILDQAENRMHTAKTLLVHMLGGLEIPLGGFRD